MKTPLETNHKRPKIFHLDPKNQHQNGNPDQQCRSHANSDNKSQKKIN